jgi:hypothetical protein
MLHQLCSLCNKYSASGILQLIAAATGGITMQQLVAADSGPAWRQLLVSTGVESKAQLLQLQERAFLTIGEVVTVLARDVLGVPDSEEQGGDVPVVGMQGEAAQAPAVAQQGRASAAEVQAQAA